GVLNENGDIIDDPEGATPGAHFAVDFENGTLVFNAASTVASVAPTTISYSIATNFDVFDLGGSGSATDVAIFYDSILRRIDSTAGKMALTRRYRPPHLAIWTSGNAIFATAARQAANLYKPGGTDVQVAAPINPNFFGQRGQVNFNKVNTPWRCGDSRIMLAD